MINNLQAVILAAGKSKRLGTGNTKLVEKLCGRELILYPTGLLRSLDIPTTVVTGYQKHAVQKTIAREHGDSITFVVQEKQFGAGHAILCAREQWEKNHVLIMSGDTPLVTHDIIEKLYHKHIESNAHISFVTTHNGDPTSLSYDRVVVEGDTIKIIRSDEFNGDPQDHCCIDAGIYIVAKDFLAEHTADIDREDPKETFHLSDLIMMANQKNDTIARISAPFDQVRGINTFQELWSAEQIKRAQLIRDWMEKGVRFCAAQSVHLDLTVALGSGTFIGSGVQLTGSTRIGNNVTIHPFSIIHDSVIEDGATVGPYTVVMDSVVNDNATVGPFAHVRDASTLGQHSTIGNFVEVTRSTIGNETNAKHLSYLGDAHIGSNVNIGAGTITCNYDGKSKHTTTIKDGAQIGSDTIIIAPVTIEEKSFTAAGSTITHNVPEGTLAIARARQTNKEGYTGPKGHTALEMNDNRRSGGRPEGDNRFKRNNNRHPDERSESSRFRRDNDHRSGGRSEGGNRFQNSDDHRFGRRSESNNRFRRNNDRRSDGRSEGGNRFQNSDDHPFGGRSESNNRLRRNNDRRPGGHSQGGNRFERSDNHRSNERSQGGNRFRRSDDRHPEPFNNSNYGRTKQHKKRRPHEQQLRKPNEQQGQARKPRRPHRHNNTRFQPLPS